jgi:hypothetical protein
VTDPARPGDLAARYGGRPRRASPAVVAGIVVLATVFVGWVVWAALGAAAPDVTAQVTGFVVRGPGEIRVEVTVAADKGRVACPLRALGADRDTVGATTVRVRVPSSGRVETTVPVRTRDTAVSAVLDDCTRPGAG